MFRNRVENTDGVISCFTGLLFACLIKPQPKAHGWAPAEGGPLSPSLSLRRVGVMPTYPHLHTRGMVGSYRVFFPVLLPAKLSECPRNPRRPDAQFHGLVAPQATALNRATQ